MPAGYLYVDGIVGDVGQGVLRDRKVLAEEGVVVVVVTVDIETGKVLTGPEIITRGWVYAPEAEDLLDEACDAVAEAVEATLAAGVRDVEALERDVRRAAGKFVSERTKRRADDRARRDGGLRRALALGRSCSIVAAAPSVLHGVLAVADHRPRRCADRPRRRAGRRCRWSTRSTTAVAALETQLGAARSSSSRSTPLRAAGQPVRRATGDGKVAPTVGVPRRHSVVDRGRAGRTGATFASRGARLRPRQGARKLADGTPAGVPRPVLRSRVAK